MEPTDLTVKILIQIRDELAKTNARIEGVAEKVERLERRSVENELRLTTAVTELRETLRELPRAMVSELRAWASPTLANHEERLAALERKAG
jgi:acetyl-CoA carboxylase alpha subunit